MSSFYKTDSSILIKKSDSGLYIIKNSTSLKDKVITLEEFEGYKTERIKKTEFYRLLNIHWRNVSDKWCYYGVRYKKLPNYTSMEDTKYQPKYIISGYSLEYPFIKVYHHGRVKLFFDINSRGKGMLWDIKTMNMLQRADIKNCAPILNIETKERI